MTFTGYWGQGVMNIPVLLIAVSSSEKMDFILVTENPLEQMSQGKSLIGCECARGSKE